MSDPEGLARAASAGLAAGLRAASIRLQQAGPAQTPRAVATAIADEIRSACIDTLHAELVARERDYFTRQLAAIKSSSGL